MPPNQDCRVSLCAPPQRALAPPQWVCGEAIYTTPADRMGAGASGDVHMTILTIMPCSFVTGSGPELLMSLSVIDAAPAVKAGGNGGGIGLFPPSKSASFD